MVQTTKKYLFSPLSGQLFLLGLFSLSLLAPDMAFAGTGGEELKDAWGKVSDIVGGFGGKLIAGVGLLGALIGSVWGFNPKLVIGAGGIGVTAALGTNFINTTVGAII